MVAAEADVVLFKLDGPEGCIELSVAIFAVRVDSTHQGHEQDHHRNDDSKDDDVELRPGHHGESRGRTVVVVVAGGYRVSRAGLRGRGAGGRGRGGRGGEEEERRRSRRGGGGGGLESGSERSGSKGWQEPHS